MPSHLLFTDVTEEERDSPTYAASLL